MEVINVSKGSLGDRSQVRPVKLPDHIPNIATRTRPLHILLPSSQEMPHQTHGCIEPIENVFSIGLVAYK
ncbi:hypothetical protein BCR34DRAFT_250209 [Clohesyomyces aquaticus]|uniref:Uncharacterized protein n=1 Tax=Clohesyomyces aquaticus TaxID=1231657 RepID=A0A1Y1Y4G9_9PLEO|nr:hypothetical protein BCR34DRAFT_250209 [Clohesyomyces aquaticus]